MGDDADRIHTTMLAVVVLSGLAVIVFALVHQYNTEVTVRECIEAGQPAAECHKLRRALPVGSCNSSEVE